MKSKISRTRSQRKLAPVPRLLRRKYKPRGKGFQPGNQHGAAHRFRPGQSGNPDGCPRYKELSNALRKFLEMDVAELKMFQPRTVAEAAAKQAVLDGLLKKKDKGWFELVGDRTEGKPATTMVLQKEDPLSDILAEVRKMSEQLGPPENEQIGDEEEQ